MTSLKHLRQALPQTEQRLAVSQMPTSQLANNHWMNAHLPLFQQTHQGFIFSTQMIHPNRGIDQHHADYPTKSDCRLGIASNSGSLPPNNAKRRALSRSINAFRLSFSKAVFSWIPVNSTALAYNSLSIFNVVRIKSSNGINNKHHYMPILMRFTVLSNRNKHL